MGPERCLASISSFDPDETRRAKIPHASAPPAAVIPAERAERLAQRARRVLATGSLAGQAVTGGGATVANRLPCDAVIADNPEDEPSQSKLRAYRRGLVPTGGLESLELAVAIFLGGEACTAAAAGAILKLRVKVRITGWVAKVVASVQANVRIAARAIICGLLFLMMALSDYGRTDIKPAQSAPPAAVIPAERAERLAQRARRVLATGSLAGQAVTGGGATVANRLPCDAVIADNPEDEPSQSKLRAYRRGVGSLRSLSWSPSN